MIFLLIDHELAMSNILDCLRAGEEIEVKGPAGEIMYVGQGKFVIDKKESCLPCHPGLLHVISVI
jgi:hypothetical protein